MARFTEKVQIGNIDTRIGSSALQSRAQQLAQFADSMRNLGGAMANNLGKGLDIANKIQTEKAQEDATRDIATGEAPTFKGGKSTYSMQYDEKMREAYLSSLSSDAQLELQNIYAQSNGSTQTYNELVDAYRGTVLKGVDADTANRFAPSFDKLAHSVRMKVNADEIKLNEQKADDIFIKNLDSTAKASQIAVSQGDALAIEETARGFLEAVDKLHRSNPLQYDVDWKRKVIQENTRAMTNESVWRDIDEHTAQSLDAGFNRLAELSDETPQDYTPEEWRQTLDRKYRELSALEREQKAQLEANKKANALNDSINRGYEIIANGLPIDPKKTDDVAKQDLQAVNDYYNAITPQIDAMPTQQKLETNLDFIKKTGVLPLRLESNANAFARNGTPEQLIAASELFARVQMDVPQALKDLPPETMAILASVNESRMAGTDILTAIDAARKNAYGLTKQEKEAIKLTSQEYRKENSKVLFNALQDRLDDDFEPGGLKGVFGDSPKASDSLKAEFSLAFDRHMTLTGGDPALAQKLAYDEVKKTWGVTNVGGKSKFMKYAPEVVYGVHGADNGWIKEQFETEMTQIGYPDATIAVNPNEAARQGKPVYSVMVLDEETGVYQPALTTDSNGNAKLLQWRPDYKQTDEYKIANDVPDENGNLLSAKEKRARKLRIEFNKSVNAVKSKFKTKLNTNTLMRDNPDDIAIAVNNAIASGKASEADRQALIDYFMGEINADSQ